MTRLRKWPRQELKAVPKRSKSRGISEETHSTEEGKDPAVGWEANLRWKSFHPNSCDGRGRRGKVPPTFLSFRSRITSILLKHEEAMVVVGYRKAELLWFSY